MLFYRFIYLLFFSRVLSIVSRFLPFSVKGYETLALQKIYLECCLYYENTDFEITGVICKILGMEKYQILSLQQLSLCQKQ